VTLVVEPRHASFQNIQHARLATKRVAHQHEPEEESIKLLINLGICIAPTSALLDGSRR
jgi:hypothetical protein